ncbi:hypothetical protein PFICI_04696 [Pestalotiopsis fici W106-1]|uniref:Uncharacterized protein n=1 Tax=Pestalotiopsis fici (strain W106-1 / CGMCC3.15140) TaxID=1229662 RepID=W3X9T8_PESFW|nr:uncharacterized protein PFICI_04696 [Pestalotiopsis fici W106-1]ETS82820.1 hypothetical protein PFICI_04696 [Pestalotiopsis fici W106-1]
MTSEPEIILYDLACIKNVCFSPVVWRIRLLLNYKNVSYKTVFLEFQDIEPTLKDFGLAPNETGTKYTVPVIQYVPTGAYMMDSKPISEFIEKTYPSPAVPLTSDLGREIEAKTRQGLALTFRRSLMPREINILSPGAQQFFRRTREAAIGHRLEDLLEGDKEEQAWAEVAETMRSAGELIRTNSAEGPFVLGAHPSYTDFFIAGSLQCARVIDEEVFQKYLRGPGFKEAYDACLPYMEKRT